MGSCWKHIGRYRLQQIERMDRSNEMAGPRSGFKTISTGSHCEREGLRRSRGRSLNAFHSRGKPPQDRHPTVANIRSSGTAIGFNTPPRASMDFVPTERKVGPCSGLQYPFSNHPTASSQLHKVLEMAPKTKIHALRAKMAVKTAWLAIAIAAHSPLSARLVTEANGFDATWASGFELSASHTVPDASIISPSTYLGNNTCYG